MMQRLRKLDARIEISSLKSDENWTARGTRWLPNTSMFGKVVDISVRALSKSEYTSNTNYKLYNTSI